MISKKVRNGLCLGLLFISSILILSACGSGDSIVGRWNFEEANWDYDWVEFFEDGSYADSWGNPRSYTLPSDGRVQIRSALDGYTFVWDYKIDGDRIEITDDDGEVVVGSRVR